MNQIEKAVEILEKGGVIAYPTNTIYGLGADIFNQSAVKRIFAIFPITATSANLSGQEELVQAEDIKLKVDFIVNGKCQCQKASTVVDLINQKIIRSGVGIKKVKNIIKK